MIAAVLPLLRDSFGCLVDIVNLVDCDALVSQVQYLVINVGVEVGDLGKRRETLEGIDLSSGLIYEIYIFSYVNFITNKFSNYSL